MPLIPSKDLKELWEKLYEMENHMRTLEWDYKREQINPYKKQQFEALLKEKEKLVSKINQLENADPTALSETPDEQ